MKFLFLAAAVLAGQGAAGAPQFVYASNEGPGASSALLRAQEPDRFQTGGASRAGGRHGACREAVGRSASARVLEMAGESAFQDGLLRLYDSQKKKAKKSGDRDALEVFVQTQIEKGESRTAIVQGAWRKGFIGFFKKPSALLNLIMNQPAETAASMTEADPVHFKMSAKEPLPLFAAVLMGELGIAEAVLSADPRLIHLTNGSGEGLLHYATSEETTVFLLKKGADPDLQDKKGLAPLHHAKSEITAKALLEGGASYDLKDRSGRTLIRYHEERSADLKSLTPAAAGAADEAADPAGSAAGRESKEHEKIARLLHSARDRSKAPVLAAAKKKQSREPSTANEEEFAEDSARPASAEALRARAEAEEAAKREREERVRRNQERSAARKRDADRFAAEREERNREEEEEREIQKELTFLLMERWESVDPSEYQILNAFLGTVKRQTAKAGKRQLKQLGADRKEFLAFKERDAGDKKRILNQAGEFGLPTDALKERWEELKREVHQSAARSVKVGISAAGPDGLTAVYALLANNPDLYLRDLDRLNDQGPNPALMTVFCVLREQILFAERSGVISAATAAQLNASIARGLQALNGYVVQELEKGNWIEMALAGQRILRSPQYMLHKSKRRLIDAVLQPQ